MREWSGRCAWIDTFVDLVALIHADLFYVAPWVRAACCFIEVEGSVLLVQCTIQLVIVAVRRAHLAQIAIAGHLALR